MLNVKILSKLLLIVFVPLISTSVWAQDAELIKKCKRYHMAYVLKEPVNELHGISLDTMVLIKNQNKLFQFPIGYKLNRWKKTTFQNQQGEQDVSGLLPTRGLVFWMPSRRYTLIRETRYIDYNRCVHGNEFAPHAKYSVLLSLGRDYFYTSACDLPIHMKCAESKRTHFPDDLNRNTLTGFGGGGKTVRLEDFEFKPEYGLQRILYEAKIDDEDYHLDRWFYRSTPGSEPQISVRCRSYAGGSCEARIYYVKADFAFTLNYPNTQMKNFEDIFKATRELLDSWLVKQQSWFGVENDERRSRVS